jgi:hypothetical protein
MSGDAAMEKKQGNLRTLQTERLAYAEPVSVPRGAAA